MTYEDDFMKVENYSTLNSNICLNTYFETALTNFTEPDIFIKKISVAACRLGWNWFTIYEAAHMMNKIIGYS